MTFQIVIFRAAKECEVQGNFVRVLFIHKRLYRMQFNVLIFPRTVVDLFALSLLFGSLFVCHRALISDSSLLRNYSYHSRFIFARVPSRKYVLKTLLLFVAE